jgi:hypothetical protein
VPGANGISPEPKPSDKRCKGLRNSFGEILVKMAIPLQISQID